MKPINWLPSQQHPYASIWSVAALLAELNQLTPVFAAKYFGACSWSAICEEQIADQALLEAIGIQTPYWLRSKELFGDLPASPALLERARTCRSCLSIGFHSEIYSFALLDRCPLHNEEWLERCPACQQPLQRGLSRKSPFCCPRCHSRLAPLVLAPKYRLGPAAKAKLDEAVAVIRQICLKNRLPHRVLFVEAPASPREAALVLTKAAPLGQSETAGLVLGKYKVASSALAANSFDSVSECIERCGRDIYCRIRRRIQLELGKAWQRRLRRSLYRREPAPRREGARVTRRRASLIEPLIEAFADFRQGWERPARRLSFFDSSNAARLSRTIFANLFYNHPVAYTSMFRAPWAAAHLLAILIIRSWERAKRRRAVRSLRQTSLASVFLVGESARGWTELWAIAIGNDDPGVSRLRGAAEIQEAAAEAVQALKPQARFRPPRRQTNAFVEDLVQTLRDWGYSRPTLNGYRHTWIALAEYMSRSGLSLQELDAQRIQSFLGQRRVSAIQQARDHGAVAFAFRRYGLANPLRDYSPRECARRKGASRTLLLDLSQATAFFEALRSQVRSRGASASYLLARGLYELGCTYSEWSSVTTSQLKCASGGKLTGVQLKGGRGRAARFLRFSEEFAQELASWLKRRTPEQASPLFSRVPGKVISPSAFRHHVRKACIAAQLPSVTITALTRSYASSRLSQAEVSLDDLKTHFGHRGFRVTESYMAGVARHRPRKQ